MNFTFLHQLLQHVEQYQEEQPERTDMGHFAQWLGTRTQVPAPALAPGETIDSAISKLVVYMNRYAKMYLKKAFEHTILNTQDEFVFLITLLHRDSATKTELIETARLEKPTGTEVIRRLLQLKLVAQHNDPDDKRSKRLSLTPEGRQALMQCLEHTTGVATLVTGNLSATEKLHLLSLLQKLEDFHQPVRQQFRQSGWGEIKAALIKT